MNTQIFNLLPNIVKQVKVVETKNNVIDYICGFDYKTVDTNEWKKIEYLRIHILSLMSILLALFDNTTPNL